MRGWFWLVEHITVTPSQRSRCRWLSAGCSNSCKMSSSHFHKMIKPFKQIMEALRAPLEMLAAYTLQANISLWIFTTVMVLGVAWHLIEKGLQEISFNNHHNWQRSSKEIFYNNCYKQMCRKNHIRFFNGVSQKCVSRLPWQPTILCSMPLV